MATMFIAMHGVLLLLLLLLLLVHPSHQFQPTSKACRAGIFNPSPSYSTRERCLAAFNFPSPRGIHPLTMNLAAGSMAEKVVDVRSQRWQAVPDIWSTLSEVCPSKVALVDEVHEGDTSITYKQLDEKITKAAGALQSLGVMPGDCISIFSENSARWFLMDQAIMRAGATNAVRGASAQVDELQYIYSNSKSSACVVETEALLSALLSSGHGLASANGPPRFVVVLFPRGRSGADIQASLGQENGPQILTFDELTNISRPYTPVQIESESIATIVYTSGTTNKPKGVMLRHSNLLAQVFGNSFNRVRGQKLDPFIGDVFVSILPCWHIFERTAEYWTLARGVTMVYSSLKSFKKDLKRWQPQFLIAVPRLFENIYSSAQQNFAAQSPFKQKLIAMFTAVSLLHMKAKRTLRNMVIRTKAPSIPEKIWATLLVFLTWPLVKIADKLAWRKVRENLGGKIKVLVSGGSSLPSHVEDFFEMIGERMIVGYGLTETSPVIANRVAEHNLPGSTGLPPPGTVIKLVDPVTRKEVTKGDSGLILVKSAGVMAGYMQNEEATKQVIDSEGWFDTGDLGRLNPFTGDLIITGRAKDVIVLSNGENVEPMPIEDEIMAQCTLISQVMLVGQDEKFLSALAVINIPELVSQGLITKEKGEHLASILGATPTTIGPVGDVEVLRTEADLLRASPTVYNAVMQQIRLACANFRGWEQVRSAYLLLEPFSVANGHLTQTLKIKRNVVANAYQTAIDKLYGKRAQHSQDSKKELQKL